MRPDELTVAGRDLLHRQLARWRLIEPAVRRGIAPAALHALRVTIRRLLAGLEWLEQVPVGGARELRSRLRTLLALTSPVRDLDVRILNLNSSKGAVPTGALRPVLRDLHLARHRQQVRLLRLLERDDTAQLLAALRRLAARVPGEGASRFASGAVRKLLRRRFRKLRKAALRACRCPDPANCHAMRLRTKRLRYLIESLAGANRRPMQRFLRRLQKLQALLGSIHDAHEGLKWIDQHARRHGRSLPPDGLAALALVRARHERNLARCLARLPQTWRRASGKRWPRLVQAL
jgi:CHAD domain-containing protein